MLETGSVVAALAAGATENSRDGSKEELEIQPQAPSIDVFEVQGNCDFERWVLSSLDLPHARYAGFHAQAPPITIGVSLLAPHSLHAPS